MKTYNTYQEAKIENPNFGIYECGDGFVADDVSGAWIPCDPADYCMTVEEFLVGNEKLPIGATILHPDGSMNLIYDNMTRQIVSGDLNSFVLLVEESIKEKPFLQTGEDFEHSKTLNFIRDRLVEVYGESKNLDYMHKLNNAIAFVERMEEPSRLCGSGESAQDKPKRMREEYVKCDLTPKEVFLAMLGGDDFYVQGELINFDGEQFWRHTGAGKSRITYISHEHEVCRRIETEMTARDEFIEEAMRFTSFNTQQLLGQMFDSGKFKLAD